MGDDSAYATLGWVYLILAGISALVKDTMFGYFAIGAAIFCMLGSIKEVLKDESG